jgi:hypothetical protein
MSTTPSEQHKAQPAAAKDDLVQFVEELAILEEYPPGDAWISLTDAARVTRTSEAMARRWVTSGRLPVKKEAVGIPPRTRLVRLSDVAKIRPIVDPTAAITGDVRKLDLPSIPRQQLQIMEDHQRLLQQVQAALAALEQHEASARATLEQVTAHVQQEAKAFRSLLSTHRDELQRALDQAEQQHQALATVVRDQAGQIERGHDELMNQARQHQHDLEQLRTRLLGQLAEAHQQLARQLSEQGQDYRSQVDQVRRDLAQHQETLTTLREALVALVEQQGREAMAALEQLERDQAQDVATLTERMEKMEQRLEQVATQMEAVQATALGYQKRADGQEIRLQDVWKLLQGEIAARQALEQQVQQSLPTRKRAT